MRAIIQRVSQAKVTVENQVTAQISVGFLVLLGVETADTQEDIDWLVGKIANLRVFSDENGVMNLSLAQVNGRVIVVSQFTLHASTRKGNRPSYIKAAPPEIAKPLYERFVQDLAKATSTEVGTGIFGAHMEVTLTNDGPVTISIDTKNRE